MKNFWGFTSNGEISVGCTGQTVYLLDKNGNEIKKFKDIIYAYTPMISPNGKIFVVKSTDGRIAVYSLETLSLIKKFRFSKVDGSQDDGFCFSPDSRQLINVERHIDSLHSAISVYDTEDFSVVSRLTFDDTMISHIEYDEETDDYYVLGYVRGDDGFSFVAKFEDNSIQNITKIPQKKYDFYESYKQLEMMGFTEKAFQWSHMGDNIERIKNMNLTLIKLYEEYKK